MYNSKIISYSEPLYLLFVSNIVSDSQIHTCIHDIGQMNFRTEIVIIITQYFYIWNIQAKYLNDVTN